MNHLIYRDTGRDYYYRTWHKPESSMFIFLHSGSGSIVTKEKSYPMNRGTLCFIGANKYHYTFPDDTERYVRSKLFIPSGELSKLLQILPKTPRFSKSFHDQQFSIGTLEGDALERAEQIFDRLSQIPVDSEYIQPELYSAILQLAVLLSQSDHTATQDGFGAMQTAVEYINEHITESLTIERICAAVYLSKYHFCRQFKEKVGLSVMEYILKTRVMMAKELLSSGTLSVTEVSEACAFSSVSYFSRVFKNETGMTPLQYKKKKI